MKIETKDEHGQDLIVDLEPNGIGEPEHLYVTVGHYQDPQAPTFYEGRLYPQGKSPFEKMEVSAYGHKRTVAFILEKLAEMAENDEEKVDDVASLFETILEDGLQTGWIEK